MKDIVITDYVPPVTQELNTDLDYARDNLYQIIETGQKGLEGILAVADQSQHPRAYEVLGTYLKNMSELQKDLVTIAKERKTARTEGPKENSVTNNNLFVGSTAELAAMLEQARKGH